MMKHSIPVAVAAAALLFSSGTAFSQTATATIGVSMTVAAECTISAEPLAFGSVGIIAAEVDASADITIQCTAGSPYQIGLSAGVGDGATVATRVMTNDADADQSVNYSLFQELTHDNVWGTATGDTVDSDEETGATGEDEVHTVYGQVFAGQNVAVGGYGDTITATITYGTDLL